MDTHVVRHESNGHSDETRDTLFLLGGVALAVFGAGLILTNPTVRRYMGQLGVGNIAKDLMPDLDRYLKLRSM
ncbi:MAG: hypothetical protein ABSC71_00825 [Candidatus Acidiferrales bacterium]|jgi:hypothetical protein